MGASSPLSFRENEEEALRNAVANLGNPFFRAISRAYLRYLFHHLDSFDKACAAIASIPARERASIEAEILDAAAVGIDQASLINQAYKSWGWQRTLAPKIADGFCTAFDAIARRTIPHADGNEAARTIIETYREIAVFDRNLRRAHSLNNHAAYPFFFAFLKAKRLKAFDESVLNYMGASLRRIDEDYDEVLASAHKIDHAAKVRDEFTLFSRHSLFLTSRLLKKIVPAPQKPGKGLPRFSLSFWRISL